MRRDSGKSSSSDKSEHNVDQLPVLTNAGPPEWFKMQGSDLSRTAATETAVAAALKAERFLREQRERERARGAEPDACNHANGGGSAPTGNGDAAGIGGPNSGAASAPLPRGGASVAAAPSTALLDGTRPGIGAEAVVECQCQ